MFLFAVTSVRNANRLKQIMSLELARMEFTRSRGVRACMYDAGIGDLGAALTGVLLRAPWPVTVPPLRRDEMGRDTRATRNKGCGRN